MAENPPSASTVEAVAETVLVSVVIPAYNSAASIRPALESVFAQTFQDFEVIVVNDGSADTEQLEVALRPYLSRIRYIKQKNLGPGAARNAAILQARGTYVAFLDSDDSWLPHHLAAQIKMLHSDPTLKLVYADSILMEKAIPVRSAFDSEPQSRPVTFEFLLSENCTVGTSSTVASREALIAAGLFDERFRCCEDFDLWLRMAFQGAKMNFDPSIHVHHNLFPDSLSGDRYVMKRARIEVYEKTAATLPISEPQRSLIRGLIDKTEAECQKDLFKQFLRDRNYGQALEAARRVKVINNSWKMALAILGLRKVPRLVRSYQRFHERFLDVRSRFRRSQKLRKLKSFQPEVMFTMQGPHR